MRGPQIIARTMSVPTVVDKNGRLWQYHSRSDHHSKVACWAILFDLLQSSSLLRRHVADGVVAFGINRTINDFSTGRKKDLDLVVARSSPAGEGTTVAFDLAELARRYKLILDPEDQAALEGLPSATAGAAGATVLVAVEAKACMTAHVRALPRLYDELTSSFATVQGDNDKALAIGFVMVNLSDEFISPSQQKGWDDDPVVNAHKQPHDTERVLDKVEEIKRRSSPNDRGFDALGAMIIDMRNDGSPVELVTAPPAPPPHNDFNYARMITRAAHLYDSRFSHV